MTELAHDDAVEIPNFRKGLNKELNDFVSDDDCRRFLISRNYDMIKSTEKINLWWEWYHTKLTTYSTDEITYTPATIFHIVDDPLEDKLYTALCPHSLEGVDKLGNPIFWEKTGTISSHFGKVKEHATCEVLLDRHIRTQALMQIRREYQSKKLNKSITKSVMVLDCQHINMAPDFMAISYFRQMITMDQTMYPETLQNFFFINTPWYFPAIYSLVSMFIDPKTANKIKILSSDYLSTLQEYIDVSFFFIHFIIVLNNILIIINNFRILQYRLILVVQ